MKEILESYVNGHLSQDQVIELLHITHSNPTSWISEKVRYYLNLSPNLYIKPNNPSIPSRWRLKEDKEFWIEQHKRYYSLELSLNDLSKEINTSYGTLQSIFKKYNLPLLTPKEVANSTLMRTKVSSTNLKKYGVENVFSSKQIQEKCKDTMMKNHGVSHALQKEEFLEKSRKTNTLKFGVSHPLKNKKILEKLKLTNQQRYGVENVFQNKEIQEKIEKTNLEKYDSKRPSKTTEVKEKSKKYFLNKYGVDNPLKVKEIRQQISDRSIQQHAIIIEKRLKENDYILMEKYIGIGNPSYSTPGVQASRLYKIKHLVCNTVFDDHLGKIPRCKKCYGQIGRSIQEEKYRQFIERILPDAQIISNARILRSPSTDGMQEIDIYLPNLGVGFEYNSLYYHSTGHSVNGSTEVVNKPENYHSMKSQIALEKGVKLYHIWEHFDRSKVESTLQGVLDLNIEKVNTGALTISECSKEQILQFYSENSLYSSPSDLDLSIGLFRNNILISCMSFSFTGPVGRVRYCSKIGILSEGGFKRLLEYSLPLLQSKRITYLTSEVETDWCPDYKESDYYKNGFQFDGHTGPSKFYTDFLEVWSSEELQEHVVRDLLCKQFPHNTEQENIQIYLQSLSSTSLFDVFQIYPFYTTGRWKFRMYV